MGGAYKWPSLKEVVQYRKDVRGLVCDLISSAPLSLPVTMDTPWVRQSQFYGIYVSTHYICTYV